MAKKKTSEIGVVTALMMAMERIVTWAGSLYEFDKTHYRRISDTKLRRDLYEALEDRAEVSLVESRLKHLKGRTSIEDHQIPPCWLEDAPPELRRCQTPIVCQNGTLLFESWLAGEPDQFIPTPETLFVVHPLPYEYDQAATCPRWEEFLLWMCSGDSSVVKLLQRYLGSVLLGLRLEKVMWMQGDGGNGKSTFVDVVAQIFGDSVAYIQLDELHQPFSKESLVGKKLNICNEFNEIRRKTENEIKRIASHESQAINRKFKEYLSVSLRLSLILVSNALPRLADQTEGIWRRLLLVKCQAKPEAEDIDFKDRLLAELPGIFNWVLEGAREVHNLRRIPVPPVVQGWVDELRMDFDPIRQWFEEYYTVTYQERDLLPTRSAYESYAEWAEDSGYMGCGIAKFNRRISDLTGLPKIRKMRDRRQCTCFVGVANRSELLTMIQWGSRSLDDLPPKVQESLQEDLALNEDSTNEVQRRINRAGASPALNTGEVRDADALIDELEGK